MNLQRVTRAVHIWQVRNSRLSTAPNTARDRKSHFLFHAVNILVTVLITCQCTYLAVASLDDGRDGWSTAAYLLGHPNIMFTARDARLMNAVFACAALITVTILTLSGWIHLTGQTDRISALPWNVSTRLLDPATRMSRTLRLKMYSLHSVMMVNTLVSQLCTALYFNYVFVILYPWTPNTCWPLCVTKLFWICFYNLIVCSRIPGVLFTCYTGLMASFTCYAHRVQLLASRLDRQCSSMTTLSTNDVYRVMRLLERWRCVCVERHEKQSRAMINLFIASYTPYIVASLLILYCSTFLQLSWQTRIICYPALTGTLGTILCLLHFAARPAWNGRRIAGHTLYSLAARLSQSYDHNARSVHCFILINSLVKSNIQPQRYKLMTQSIDYHMITALLCEGATYFLLLVTILEL